MKKEGKIICGFAGIGKSYLAKNTAGVVDLESTPFNKNWELYADVAKHMSVNGYTVLMSCHKEIREKLKEKQVNYWVAIPQDGLKEEYISRYKNRGNTEQFVKMMSENFDKFIEEIKKSELRIMFVNEFLVTP